MRWQHEADNVASPAGAGPGTLASDADRDRVVGLLSEAFAEGRLTADEHVERARAAHAARTWAELAQLIADLPIPADSAAGRPAAIPGRVDQCLPCALLVLCPPAGIAWLLAVRRRSRPERGQPLALGQAAGQARQPAQRRAGDWLWLSPGAAGAVPGSCADSGGRSALPSPDGMSHVRGDMHAEDR